VSRKRLKAQLEVVGDHTAEILRHPAVFGLRVLKGFRANQGLLLAGAVAYYALLSLIPFLILILIALSHIFDQTQLLATVRTYLEFVVPGESTALVSDLTVVLGSQEVIGPVVLLSMLFSSALAFTVLENAMSVIFHHRVAIRRRRFIVSALRPYAFILVLGVGLVVVTFVAGGLTRLATENIMLFGLPRSLEGVANYLLYAIGVLGELFILTSIYIVMPVGPPSWRHAIIGGASATLLWEVTRHIIIWYLTSVSHLQMVYGSLTTAIAALLTVESAAIVLLFGAQVIAEYERVLKEPIEVPAKPMRTEAVK